MSSAKARRISAAMGSLVATLHAVLADLCGSLGEKVRRNLPGSELVTSIWEGVRGLRDDGGVTEEEMGKVVPRGWRDRAFHPEEVSAPGKSDREVLAAHDAETTNSHEAQKKLRKQVNRVRYDRYVTSLDGLPTHERPPEGIGPFRVSETRECAKGQATESVRTRSCRVVTSEAGGCSTRHTNPGVPVQRTATSGDRGALGGDVSRL